ncbi:MAG: FkbM family methyltransferase, partial [Lentisphaerota bacterium]
ASCAHLLVSPDWPQILARLRAEGVSDDQLFVMPIPDGELWTWWRFATSVKSNLQFDGETVDLPPERFIQYIVELGRGQMEEGRLALEPGLYGCAFSGLWQKNAAKIDCVVQNLSDIASRNNYLRILYAPPETQWQYYIETVFQRQQYADHIRIAPGNVILNGGIASGTEVALFLAGMDGSGCLHNVDPLGHDFLSPAVAPAVDYYSSLIRLHTLALSDSEDRIQLPVGDGHQAIGKHRDLHLEGFKTMTFDACRIDTLVERENLNRLDLIKLDLEGAEEYVLKGMMRTVQRLRPQIALSIYHRPEHLFELPHQLMSRLDNYSFHLEAYSFERWEVILYAIPNERAQPGASPGRS